MRPLAFGGGEEYPSDVARSGQLVPSITAFVACRRDQEGPELLPYCKGRTWLRSVSGVFKGVR
jgi:hypothetical protein